MSYRLPSHYLHTCRFLFLCSAKRKPAPTAAHGCHQALLNLCEIFVEEDCSKRKYVTLETHTRDLKKIFLNTCQARLRHKPRTPEDRRRFSIADFPTLERKSLKTCQRWSKIVEGRHDELNLHLRMPVIIFAPHSKCHRFLVNHKHEETNANPATFR